MSPYTDVYKKTEEHVTDMFHKHHPSHMVLHNLLHTTSVVRRVNEIAGHYHLSEDDSLAVFVAAWFHDTGYLFVEPALHEQKGVELMKSFVKDFNLPAETVNKIESCIMATREPREPHGTIEEILCDADTYQFGNKKGFELSNKLAFEEALHQSGLTLTHKAFDEGTLKMLQAHKYYTTYCSDLLSEGKKKNMKKIKKRLKNDEEYENEMPSISEKEGTTKGMQTMLRLASSNHIKLSDMADRKANILISVNAIIISVVLSQLVRKLQTDPYLVIPTITFLSFSVIIIVIAILATRPKLNTGRFVDSDVINKKTNLLFFGNFHKMTHMEYETAMRTMMKDTDYLYSSMIQDIFHLGQVLGKKYRLIRLAYNLFMIGIIVSVIAFTLSALFYPAQPAGVISNTGGSPF